MVNMILVFYVKLHTSFNWLKLYCFIYILVFIDPAYK